MKGIEGDAISRKSIMHEVFELYCRSELHSPRAAALEEVIELIKKEKTIEGI